MQAVLLILTPLLDVYKRQVERYELIATESSPNFWYDAVYLYRQKSLSSR